MGIDETNIEISCACEDFIRPSQTKCNLSAYADFWIDHSKL